MLKAKTLSNNWMAALRYVTHNLRERERELVDWRGEKGGGGKRQACTLAEHKAFKTHLSFLLLDLFSIWLLLRFLDFFKMPKQIYISVNC